MKARLLFPNITGVWKPFEIRCDARLFPGRQGKRLAPPVEPYVRGFEDDQDIKPMNNWAINVDPSLVEVSSSSWGITFSESWREVANG